MEEYLTDLVKKGTVYQNGFSPALSNAIYLYGSNSIKDIIAFIDTSDSQDGSYGMIITSDSLYYHMEQTCTIHYKHIKSLSISLKRSAVRGEIVEDRTYIFNNPNIDNEMLVRMLGDYLGKAVKLKGSAHDQIRYYVLTVLNDIKNDEYEDVELDFNQRHQLEDFYEDIEAIDKLPQADYQSELEDLCIKALQFFDSLDLESDEIDTLSNIYNAIDKKNDKMIEQAQQYYEKMMDDYSKGDTKLFDYINDAMKDLGMDMNDMANKTPEEMDAFIDQICKKYHISRSQIEKIAKKTNYKN